MFANEEEQEWDATNNTLNALERHKSYYVISH